MLSSYFIKAAATVLLTASFTLADPLPKAIPNRVVERAVATNSPVSVGCYSSSYSMVYNNTNDFQTSGLCQGVCVPLGYVVVAVNGTDCYCGATMPPLASKSDIGNCSTVCPGYGSDKCGQTGGVQSYWTVWNAGVKNSITNADTSSSTTASTSATATPKAGSTSVSSAPSVVTIGGQTIVVTASASSNAGDTGPSKAGIAAGVVVGVVAIAAIAGGVWFFLRSKKRKQVEEEYKRQAAISAFTSANSKPGSSGGNSVFDTRLEPAIMAQRRMSDGSIADNQDYSRRILKVTNA